MAIKAKKINFIKKFKRRTVINNVYYINKKKKIKKNGIRGWGKTEDLQKTRIGMINSLSYIA